MAQNSIRDQPWQSLAGGINEDHAQTQYTFSKSRAVEKLYVIGRACFLDRVNMCPLARAANMLRECWCLAAALDAQYKASPVTIFCMLHTAPFLPEDAPNQTGCSSVCSLF